MRGRKAPASNSLVRGKGLKLTPQKNQTLDSEDAEWLVAHRDNLIGALLKWCSDFNRQDAEDTVANLFERICRRGIQKTLGIRNEANLFCHLRREKENFRRDRNRLRRGGDAVQVDWEEWIEKEPGVSSGGDAIFTRSDYRLLDDYLQLLCLESKGRLKVVVLAMRRVFDSYQTPADLVEVMTPCERELFFPKDARCLDGDDLEKFILEAVEKTLEKLRLRLRQLRESIPMN